MGAKRKEYFRILSHINHCSQAIAEHFYHRATDASVQSKYEIAKSASPFVSPTVYQSSHSKQFMQAKAFEHTLSKFYEQHPVIIILGQEQREEVMSNIEICKYKCQLRSDSDTILTIRDWEYSKRGVDTRFRRDAGVLIILHASKYHGMLQIVGRSSRTRGICEGTLFVVTDDRADRVILRLKHQGLASMQSLEKLMQVLEKRARVQTLEKKFNELKQNHTKVVSNEDLKNHFSEVVMGWLTKDVFQRKLSNNKHKQGGRETLYFKHRKTQLPLQGFG